MNGEDGYAVELLSVSCGTIKTTVICVQLLDSRYGKRWHSLKL